jgi:hypothetical protein
MVVSVAIIHVLSDGLVANAHAIIKNRSRAMVGLDKMGARGNTTLGLVHLARRLSTSWL